MTRNVNTDIKKPFKYCKNMSTFSWAGFSYTLRQKFIADFQQKHLFVQIIM